MEKVINRRHAHYNEVVKKALDELTNVSNGIVSKMYQSANPNGDPNGSNPNGGNDGEPEVVVD